MKVYFSILLLGLLCVIFGEARRERCIVETSFTPCPQCRYETQDELDECYMQEALNFGVSQNPSRPFGALIVDSFRNVISCYGVSNGNVNTLLHGEIAAFFNCTALYPSPIGNDVVQPGLNWKNQTLYTTAESCPMCAAASMWRGIGRVVYGTDIPTLARLGSKQITIRQRDVYKQGYLELFKTGGQGITTSTSVPYLKGGVLKNRTDQAFFAGFGFAYPTSPFYGTKEDVFLEDASNGCSCHDHDE